MPLQNRVQPTGEILVHPARGGFMGNRGILHRGDRTLGKARWKHKAWVCCLTEFRGRKRPLMAPHAYTELFFHDEAVALAAGHRPCGECRRSAFTAYLEAAGHHGRVTEFDRMLHAARAVPRVFGQRRHRAEMASLPDGTFILSAGIPALLWQGALRRFSPAGYHQPERLPNGEVTVLTPLPTLVALRNGYLPQIRLPDCAP